MEIERIKYFEFIQNIITRMNTNSFQIKTWNITIMGAFLGLFATTKNTHFILIPIIPTILFWFLDTYYLTQERRFRGLFNEVVGNTKNDHNLRIFEMRLDHFVKGEYSFINVFTSFTISVLYLSILAILFLIYFILKSV